MEEQLVIVAYKPKPGKEEALHLLMREHYSILKQQDLVTDRTPVMMQAKDGTVIEVFGWKSKAAIESAHTNAAVLKMWAEYNEACDYVPIATIVEALNLFSSFAPFV